MQGLIDSLLGLKTHRKEGDGEMTKLTDYVQTAEAYPAGSEGKKKLVQHLQRERKRAIVAAKKAATRPLQCEACRFRNPGRRAEHAS